ncbi:uncharacterized protein LOC131032133 [Cryptomeria japonica]|uniref:uncharacterized protein LOC131032133 n=1 Tax=Cryptomeria japonica TaxID=3369 RepID=UPI0027DAA307|nr:uncharacterized protein LOC131032133 [Cryptomeria japonica]
MRRCVPEEDVFDILRACHTEPCGGHFAAQRTTQKILTTGYYWPTIHKDYQGPQFTLELIVALVKEYEIRPWKSTPYHPQANGQVEVTNKELENILTKTIALHKRDWAMRLPEAVWAYHTTWKTTTGLTPYELIYGKKAVLPIEFEIKTLQTALQLSLSLSDAQKDCIVQLHSLDELHQDALFHTEVIQKQRALWHDRHIRQRSFQPRDWALLYDSRFQDFKGKFHTRWLGPYEVEHVYDNSAIQLCTVDSKWRKLLVNGHRLKLYRKPLSKEAFFLDVAKELTMVPFGLLQN